MVSVVRKVIKEEQRVTPTWGSRLTTKKVFKDIVKAADDFSSRVGSGKKRLTKTKSTRAKGKEIPPKKHIADQKQEPGKSPRVIPRVIPREKVESPQSQTKKMKKGSKNVVYPGKTGEKNTGHGGKKNTGKCGSKGKNNGDKIGGKAKKGRK